MLDKYAFEAVSLLPMGEGKFIMPLNATVRKAIKKQKGATVKVQLAVDGNPNPVKMPPALQECLADEPEALARWEKLPQSHRHYWIKWIESAKTTPTKTKRIAKTVTAMARNMDYGTMLRSLRNDKNNLPG